MNPLNRRHFMAALLVGPLAAFGRSSAQATEPTRPEPPIEPWRLDAAELERWRRAPRQPLYESSDPAAATVLAAMRREEAITFSYCGGSAPWAQRRVSPGQLFAVEGFPGTYLSGYCHTRRAERTFLIARMSGVVPCAPTVNA